MLGSQAKDSCIFFSPLSRGREHEVYEKKREIISLSHGSNVQGSSLDFANVHSCRLSTVLL
jgi:hypothetical protein